MTLPTLKEVDEFELPKMLIPRVSSENGYSIEVATNLVKEAKRMLYLHSISKAVVSPSKIVDMAWHEMLMFTRFYQDFSKFIGVFVHHDPTPGPPGDGSVYAITKTNYQKYFKTEPNSQYWP